MKIFAVRLERDQDDIRTLYGLCGFTTAEVGLRLVETSYSRAVIAPRVQFLLQEMFPERGREGPSLDR